MQQWPEDAGLLQKVVSLDAAEQQAPKQPAEPAVRADRPLLGLASYALSSVFMAAMLTFAKLLGQRRMPVFQILLARSTSILAIALAVCVKESVNPWGNRRKLLAVRGVLGFGAIGCYFWAVQLLPLQDAMVLTFLAPLWVALLGPIFIQENPTKLVLAAIPLCVVGVGLITQPEFLGFAKAQQRNLWGVVLASAQALFSAGAKMAVRELRKTETANVSIFYLSFCSTLGALAGCLCPKLWGATGTLRWPVGAVEWLLLLGVGGTGYGSQICMTFALQNARAAPAIAMSYLSVVWSLLSGVFIFQEVPNAISLVGVTVICSCTLTLGVFERRKKAAVAGERPGGAVYAALPVSEPAINSRPSAERCSQMCILGSSREQMISEELTASENLGRRESV